MRSHFSNIAQWITLAVLLTSATTFAQDETTEVDPPKYPGDAEYEPTLPSPAALANPAVRAAFERPRQTPSDYVRATLNLLNLGEPALAGNVFHELLALELDDAAKAKLAREFGPAAMLRLTRAPELGPRVTEFVNSAMGAANAEATSAERIAKLVEQLGSDSDATQRSTIAALAGVGQPAVVPLIAVLGDQASSDRQKLGARAALVRLGPLAERPLLAMLDSGDAQLVSEAASLLAALGTSQAAPLMALRAVGSSGGSATEQAYTSLTGQQPTLESATGLIERTLNNLETGIPVFEPDAEGNIVYWVWQAKPVNEQQPTPITLSVADANLLYRNQLAAQLKELKPGIPSIESQALRLAIEAVAILDGDRAWPDLSNLPADQLNRVLFDALKENQVASAILALQALAERRDPGVLITGTGQPSATARALEHPHPSVRSAAINTIAAIDSPTPFPGASKLCPAIVRLASAGGQRVVIAGAPRIDTATTWVGALSTMGFNGQVAATGRDVIELGRQRGDVELILIDMLISRPVVRDVVFQLRSQPATALVPIGLLAREPQLATARRIAFEHEGVMAFPRPHTDQAVRDIAAQLLQHLPRDWPTAEERLAQANDAIAVMNQLLAAERDFYRLRAASSRIAQSVRPAAPNPAAWELLAQLGTRDSQVSLLAYASAPALNIEARRAAAKAFDQSVKRFGVRLTSNEITRQYDLYNASETDTSDVQQVLGSLLDAIEAGRDKQ